MITSENSCEVLRMLGLVDDVSLVPRIINVIFPSNEYTGCFLDYCEGHRVVRRKFDGRLFVLGDGPDLDNESGDEIYYNVTEVSDLMARERPDCDLVRPR